MYRTLQALRSFGRIFTLILPSFYAPAFAQLALDLESRAISIMCAVLTPLVLLPCLFQTAARLIEDPFFGFITLTGSMLLKRCRFFTSINWLVREPPYFLTRCRMSQRAKLQSYPKGLHQDQIWVCRLWVWVVLTGFQIFVKSVKDAPVGHGQGGQDIDSDSVSNFAMNDRRTSLGCMSTLGVKGNRSRFGSTF